MSFFTSYKQKPALEVIRLVTDLKVETLYKIIEKIFQEWKISSIRDVGEPNIRTAYLETWKQILDWGVFPTKVLKTETGKSIMGIQIDKLGTEQILDNENFLE